MFKCDYNLNGECQLYSEECRSDKTANCKMYLECHSCRYKMRSYHEEPCTLCFALHKKREQ